MILRNPNWIRSQPEKEYESRKESQNVSIGRPPQQRAALLSVGRPSGRPLFSHGRPGYICAHRAHRSTAQSTGPSSGRPIVFLGLLHVPFLAPFVYRSLCYLPMSRLSPLSLHLQGLRSARSGLKHTANGAPR